MLLLGIGQEANALPALRPVTGSGNLGFPAHLGLPPKYSHAYKTPWSVFQDGSDQSGSKPRSWLAQRPETQGAARKNLDQPAAGQTPRPKTVARRVAGG